jgi:hypothetical protein
LALGSNGKTILDAREENVVDKVTLSCKLLEANDTSVLLNVVVEYLTFLLRILDVPGTNRGPEAAYPEFFVFFLSPSSNA